jgi:hypothetical protein
VSVEDVRSFVCVDREIRVWRWNSMCSLSLFPCVDLFTTRPVHFEVPLTTVFMRDMVANH